MTASRDSESCTVLYKILTPAEVEAMPESNWRGTALDLKDSFIHLSSADQLPGTLGRFFSPEFFKGDQLYLLPLPRSNVRPDQRLQFDEAHGQKFGHIYDVSPSSACMLE